MPGANFVHANNLLTNIKSPASPQASERALPPEQPEQAREPLPALLRPEPLQALLPVQPLRQEQPSVQVG